MKTIKCMGIMLLVGLLAFSGSVFAADITNATVEVTSDATGFAEGDVLDFKVSVNSQGGEVGGLALTLTYDTAIFAAVTGAEVDPVTYCTDETLGDCSNPYGTAGQESTILCVVNDDAAGTAKIACASAQAITSDINVKLRVKASDVAEDAVIDDTSITPSATTITNASAGYETPTEIPMLTGMPDESGATADTYTATSAAADPALEIPKGSSSTCTGGKGDLNNDGNINTGDALQILFFLNGFVDETALCGESDLNGDGNVNTGDALQILFFLNGFVDAL